MAITNFTKPEFSNDKPPALNAEVLNSIVGVTEEINKLAATSYKLPQISQNINILHYYIDNLPIIRVYKFIPNQFTYEGVQSDIIPPDIPSTTRWYGYKVIFEIPEYNPLSDVVMFESYLMETYGNYEFSHKVIRALHPQQSSEIDINDMALGCLSNDGIFTAFYRDNYSLLNQEHNIVVLKTSRE